MSESKAPPSAVLERYGVEPKDAQRRIEIGLINRTFVVERAARGDEPTTLVLQELHEVFGADVNEDIDAVTTHLASKGLVTPRMVRTEDGALYVEHEGKIWRAQTFVAGTSVERFDDPEHARQAGALVGRFHVAVDDLDHAYRFTRTGVHDTHAHLRKLARALDEKREHPLFDAVFAEASPLLARAAGLPDFSKLPLRHAHGDLKVSNMLFDDQGRAICLVDLDTLGHMSWPLEMGDALRSWTNPRREDVMPASVDVELFAAAVMGYASEARDIISDEESAHLVDGMFLIASELAARFLADALFENYFGWDQTRYDTRGAHNLARGAAMRDLARSIEDVRTALEEIVTMAFQ
jgi:Ser/Thr protein kinase RdoA (MazF antagonist)